MLLILIGAILGLQIQTTVIADDCKKSNYEGKQCKIVKAQVDLGKKIEKL